MKIVGGGLWEELRRLGKRRGRKVAAVAYVTSDKYIRFGRNDVLIADASDQAIKTGQTSVAVLKAAHARGAKLFSYPGLHAKVYAFDRVVVVGSANLSESSANDLLEAAIITESARAVAGVQFLIERLRESADPIDEHFLRRVSKLPVRAPLRGHGIVRTRGPRSTQGRIWLLGLTKLEDDAFPSEVERVQKGIAKVLDEHDVEEDDVSWMRFTGKSRFIDEAKPGDSVIQIWRDRSDAKRAWVYRPVPILRRQKEPTCVRFFVRAFADGDDTAFSLSAFAKLWKVAGFAGVLPKNPTRELVQPRVDKLLALLESE